MAWIDDRIWCHPKLADLTDAAFRGYVNGVAYSSGFATSGVLTAGQQRAIGVTAKTRNELLRSILWDDIGSGSIRIHDWDEHNGKRDARRRADRERKREIRAKQHGTSPGASAGQSKGTSAGQHADKPADRRTLTDDGTTEEQNQGLLTELHYAEPEPSLHDDEPPANDDEQPSDITNVRTLITTSLAQTKGAATA